MNVAHSFTQIHNMKWCNIIVASLVPVFCISCSTTKISSSWKSADAVTKPYHNVMVWGILPEKDSIVRKQMEGHLLSDLVSKGYHAVSSLEVYKSKAYQKLTAQEIIDEFKFTSVDAIITIVLLKKEKEEKYYPSGVFDQPLNTSGNLDKYYNTTFERIFTPGYYLTTTNYFWEVNLFEVKEDRLTYSVRTNSFDPESTEKLAHENGVKIMKDMLKNKIILDRMPVDD